MTTRRRASRLAAPAAAAALALALPACGAVDTVKSAAEGVVGDAVASEIQKKVQDELKQAGVDLKSGPDCTGGIDDASKSVKVQCTGETTDNQKVDGLFEAKQSGTGCPGRIYLKSGTKEIIKEQTFNPCSLTN